MTKNCPVCLEPHTTPCTRLDRDKLAQEQHIVLDLYRREDGGLRIAGRDTARGLILSDEDAGTVLSKVWPALYALKHPITNDER